MQETKNKHAGHGTGTEMWKFTVLNPSQYRFFPKIPLAFVDCPKMK